MALAPALILLFLVTFLLGSVPWGLVISRVVFHKDIRKEGSGNIGTTNAMRSLGKAGGASVFVLDFGTATTYDLVTEDGCFGVGITAPGIRISAKALWEDTAKLPEIEIKKPDSILAKETITSMQAGLVYGQIGQTEYIIRQVMKETGYENLKVVATGGLGRIIADATDMIQIYDRNLTLEGLRIIYEKNTGRKS